MADRGTLGVCASRRERREALRPGAAAWRQAAAPTGTARWDANTTMFRNQITPPVKGPGLFLFFLQHFGFIAYISYHISEINNYRTATLGSVTVAEAAYLTSQWTQVVVSCCAWIAWTLFCTTFILANRITRLHDAYLSSFAVPPEQAPEPETDPLAPRVGNHSLAGVSRREVYAGRDFTVHGDGMVVSRLGNDAATWRTEAEFKEWADRQSSPYSP